MAKNKKQYSYESSADSYAPTMNKHYVQRPEVVSIDVLATMLDEDLADRLRTLDSDRNKALEHKLEGTEWEVEICYVRREQAIRRARREAHDVYARQQWELGDESMLPTCDFDRVNSRFVELS